MLRMRDSHERRRHGSVIFLNGAPLHRRLLASLIICVALLTQFGASLWGAAAARDGVVGCHKSMAWSTTTDFGRAGEEGRATPAEAPAKPDHDCCSLCELSFGFLESETPVFETQAVAYRRVLLAEPVTPAPLVVFNRSAPARAPPSQA